MGYPRRVSRLPWFALAASSILPFGVYTLRSPHPEIAAATAPSPGGRAIIIGGGPNTDHNQVAIESNVKYVYRLIPEKIRRSTLFADGEPDKATVLYVEDVDRLPFDVKAVALTLHGNDRDYFDNGKLRAPSIPGGIDGASSRQNLLRLIDGISSETDVPNSLLLYFTGHGGPLNSNLENNHYDLWGRGGVLSVKELADQIAHAPVNVPVTVVMAQCYSGSFGNLIFENGDPSNGFVGRDICGFFATTKERVAAGCTPELNEADYKDFTSYFFAALSGRDRLGRRVPSADYNRDGKISLDEAFCYTLIHDESIDVPVCTSDVFLRHEVKYHIDDLVKTSYSDIKRWASRCQRVALDALAAKLSLQGEERYATAFKMITPVADQAARRKRGELANHFKEIRSERRAALFGRWPDLKRPGDPSFSVAYAQSLQYIHDSSKSGDGDGWKELISAFEALKLADRDSETSENRAAAALRFVRLCTSITLAHELMQTGSSAQKERFAHLQLLEHRTLFESGGKAPSEPQEDPPTAL